MHFLNALRSTFPPKKHNMKPLGNREEKRWNCEKRWWNREKSGGAVRRALHVYEPQYVCCLTFFLGYHQKNDSFYHGFLCVVPRHIARFLWSQSPGPSYLWDKPPGAFGIYNYLHTCMHVLTSFFLQDFSHHWPGLRPPWFNDDQHVKIIRSTSIHPMKSPFDQTSAAYEPKGYCIISRILPPRCRFHAASIAWRSGNPNRFGQKCPYFWFFRIEHQWLRG